MAKSHAFRFIQIPFLNNDLPNAYASSTVYTKAGTVAVGSSGKYLMNSFIHPMSGVDFTKGFKTWHKFSTEIRFMLIPIIVLFIAHEFITGNF